METHSESSESAPEQYRRLLAGDPAYAERVERAESDLRVKIEDVRASADRTAEGTSRSFSNLLLATMTMVISIYLVLRYGIEALSRQWGQSGDALFGLTLAFGLLSLVISCVLFYLIFRSSKKRRAERAE